MKEQFIQEVCCLDRAIQIAKTIKNLWVEPYEDIIEGECGVSFGSCEGYVIYNYSTTKPVEIFDFLKEIGFKEQ